MKTYNLKWEIDIEAETPEEAVQRALEIQRDSQSIATVFEVFEKTDTGLNYIGEIDLLKE